MSCVHHVFPVFCSPDILSFIVLCPHDEWNQKLARIQLKQAADEETQRQFYRRPMWISGLALIILGSFADFTALGFGAQSLIAPLGSLTLVSNVLLAPIMLGETINRSDIYATGLIIVGSAITVSFASHQDTLYEVNRLFRFSSRPQSAIYALLVLASMGALCWAIRYVEKLQREQTHSEHYRSLIPMHRFSYAALSGIVGAQSALFAKCTAELLINTFSGNGFLFAYMQTHLVVACLALCIFGQVFWLNSGLRRFEAPYIVPVFQSVWIVVSVIGGLIFFGEYAEMSGTQSVMFPFGLVLTIGTRGVYWLSQKSVSPRQDSTGRGPAVLVTIEPEITDTMILACARGYIHLWGSNRRSIIMMIHSPFCD